MAIKRDRACAASSASEPSVKFIVNDKCPEILVHLRARFSLLHLNFAGFQVYAPASHQFDMSGYSEVLAGKRSSWDDIEKERSG